MKVTEFSLIPSISTRPCVRWFLRAPPTPLAPPSSIVQLPQRTIQRTSPSGIQAQLPPPSAHSWDSKLVLSGLAAPDGPTDRVPTEVGDKRACTRRHCRRGDGITCESPSTLTCRPLRRCESCRLRVVGSESRYWESCLSDCCFLFGLAWARVLLRSPTQPDRVYRSH